MSATTTTVSLKVETNVLIFLLKRNLPNSEVLLQLQPHSDPPLSHLNQNTSEERYRGCDACEVLISVRFMPLATVIFSLDVRIHMYYPLTTHLYLLLLFNQVLYSIISSDFFLFYSLIKNLFLIFNIKY